MGPDGGGGGGRDPARIPPGPMPGRPPFPGSGRPFPGRPIPGSGVPPIGPMFFLTPN